MSDVPKDLNDDVHSDLKKQVCTWCVLAVKVLSGVEVSVLRNVGQKLHRWKKKSSEPAQNNEDVSSSTKQ